MTAASIFRILLGLTVSHAVSSLGTSVVAPAGTFVGRTVRVDGTQVRAFLGIPFAKPPVGRLRFRKPQPLGASLLPIRAKKLPPGCPQYSPLLIPFYDYPPGLSEDCLYLNIWVPQDAGYFNQKTVMFWIHTGAFAHSSSRLDYFEGQVLAARGDVIVVTTNYRLGALGFFFSDTQEAPGNVGLLDIVKSLYWVRTNIGSFGGDVDSITLFGHSAGAIAAGMLTVSPLTRGHFKRVILQSGAPTSTAGRDNSRTFRTSQNLARAVGCADNDTTLEKDPNAVVACMRGKDPFELEMTLSQITREAIYFRPFYPRFGDEVLPVDPRIAIINGNFQPVEVLIGSNNGDGALLMTAAFLDVFGLYGQKDPQINKTLAEDIIRELLEQYPYREAAVRQYLGDVDPENYYLIRQRAFTAKGDFERTCPAEYFAESYAEKNPKVFYYYFTHHASNTPWAPWMLAVHFDETPFVFGYPLRYPQNYTMEEQELSKQMINIWTNFAKTGTPQSDWPRYSKEQPKFQFLNITTLQMKEYGFGPNRENCNFFRPYFGFRKNSAS